MPASASAVAAPGQRARDADWPSPAAISATSTGTAPTTSAACVTLVRSMPAFWSRITAPKPIAPAAATRGVERRAQPAPASEREQRRGDARSARRSASRRRATRARASTAARSGPTARPRRRARGWRCGSCVCMHSHDRSVSPRSRALRFDDIGVSTEYCFGEMAISLDSVDLQPAGGAAGRRGSPERRARAARRPLPGRHAAPRPAAQGVRDRARHRRAAGLRPRPASRSRSTSR